MTTTESAPLPAWDNSFEYPSLTSNEFVHDQTEARSLLRQITQKLESLGPLLTQASHRTDEENHRLLTKLQCVAVLNEQVSALVGNLHTFVYCERAVDGSNTEAQRALSQVEELIADHQAAVQPANLFLSQAPQSFLDRYFDHVHAAHQRFQVSQLQERRETLLSEKEEALLSRMNLHGPNAFGELYRQIAGNLTCTLNSKEIGLAEASGYLYDPNEAVRKAAWHAVQDAWSKNSLPCAAILNGIAGWRLDEAKKRSQVRPVHFLEGALRDARIEHETLEAMLQAIRESGRPLVQRAAKALAQAMGKSQIDPWDSVASAPQTGPASKRSFTEATTLIHQAFSDVDSSFGDFVDSMIKCRWIEARIKPNKRQGAFCIYFPKSRTPRVFQSYIGSVADILTLAHELGHAHHSWVMRDLPLLIQDYPMTLAETASTFAETTFSESLLNVGTPREKFEVAWQNAISAVVMLANIPARFEFERRFYERRSAGFVSAQELSDLTREAWAEWYGEAMSFPEHQFWMTKLHFSIPSISFYNFPYTFGYLFSLAIYAKREELGSHFFEFYQAILRDTGRMKAEDLVLKHFGEDIRQPGFWKKSLAIVERQISQFEAITAPA